MTMVNLKDVEQHSWGQLSPLPPACPAVPEMPEDLIPGPLRPWLADIRERTQIPLDFVAAPAVVALSSVIGRTVGIYPKQHDDWLCVPNLWGVVIGRPGVLKSPALAEALKPLSRLARQATDDHKEAARLAEAGAVVIQAQIDAKKMDARAAAKAANSADMEVAKNEIARLAADLEGAETHERRYIVNDGTVEKLGELLNKNPRGLLLVRDELVGFLRTLEKQGHEGDRPFYLEAWAGAGSGFTYDRIGRGTLHIDALALSIVGGMTPGKLSSYISGALGGGGDDDGLLQRFQLAVWPDQSPDWRNVDRYPDTTAKNAAFGIFAKLDRLQPSDLGIEPEDGEIPALRFEPAAQELFNDFRAKLELRIRRGGDEFPAFESHISKYRSLLPSLALVFHLVDCTQSAAGPVSLSATRLAARWCDYLERHARKVYAAELYPELTAAHLLADKIKAGAINDGMTIREIYRPQWSGLKKPESVWGGVERLRDTGALRIEAKETAGRPAEIIHINPAFSGRAGNGTTANSGF